MSRRQRCICSQLLVLPYISHRIKQAKSQVKKGGKRGGRRTRNEMRRGRGQTLPRNADASRMHTRAHGSCTDVVLSSFPSPSANNKLWSTILKGGLVTHLRDTAQSNNVASEFVDPRGSDPPSNSGPHRKAPKVHPHWNQRHTRVLLLT